MNSEIKKQWLAALRNGEYQQSTGGLRNAYTFCCLGVLCDLHAKATGNQWTQPNCQSRKGYKGYFNLLPPEIAEWAGIAEKNSFHTIGGCHVCVQLPNSCVTNLASMNDNGKSFNEIADVIDVYL